MLIKGMNFFFSKQSRLVLDEAFDEAFFSALRTSIEKSLGSVEFEVTQYEP